MGYSISLDLMAAEKMLCKLYRSKITGVKKKPLYQIQKHCKAQNKIKLQVNVQ